MNETFSATIVHTDGRNRIAFKGAAYYQTRLNKLKPGTEMWVTITDRAPTRSAAQNRLYFFYLGLIEEETGNAVDALHEHFAGLYLALPPQTVKLPSGELTEVRTRRSTTTLSKRAFSEYMEKIERDTGVRMPDTQRTDLLDGMAIDVRREASYPEGEDVAPRF